MREREREGGGQELTVELTTPTKCCRTSPCSWARALATSSVSPQSLPRCPALHLHAATQFTSRAEHPSRLRTHCPCPLHGSSSPGQGSGAGAAEGDGKLEGDGVAVKLNCVPTVVREDFGDGVALGEWEVKVGLWVSGTLHVGPVKPVPAQLHTGPALCTSHCPSPQFIDSHAVTCAATRWGPWGGGRGRVNRQTDTVAGASITRKLAPAHPFTTTLLRVFHSVSLTTLHHPTHIP